MGFFYSCPDLSSLQISYPASPVSPAEFASDIEGDINTEPERPSSPESPHLRVPQRRSKRKEVSRKARGVIGKVRGLRRIAAGKMAHPAIKIDTNVQTKRGLEDSEVGLGVVTDHNTGLGADEEGIPPFLRQSVAGE
ncbi:protein-tyrosine phosphatase-like protein [Penicillium riverlandense]|uniref:protein-tyrosine phosphatase-like protein n=1 Tax=Penicillium riverlandense TaxID=1903569 RepID=UPI0025493DA9|nr:protein-tyrosine phosphatase-like protein [Penicillium riverlandense]KAJ5808395.1 protein-tyrosine phosphatase-like protein [Penicillium riverlandense]